MRRAAGVLAALTLAPATASADPCAHAGYGMATGPTVAPLLDGGLGRAHRVCGRSEVGLRAGGALLIDRPNFYGRVGGGLTLEGSWAPNRYTEVFAGLELLRFDTVIQTLSASRLGFGHTYVGGAVRGVTSARTSLGFNAKLVLPTAVGLYREAFPLSFDFGVAGQFAASAKVHVHGQLGVIGTAASTGQALRMGAAFTTGAEFLPVRRVGVVVDVHGIVGYARTYDVIAGSAALRFSSLRRFGFELAGTFPFVGRGWPEAAAYLRATVRLGKVAAPGRR